MFRETSAVGWCREIIPSDFLMLTHYSNVQAEGGYTMWAQQQLHLLIHGKLVCLFFLNVDLYHYTHSTKQQQ